MGGGYDKHTARRQVPGRVGTPRTCAHDDATVLRGSSGRDGNFGSLTLGLVGNASAARTVRVRSIRRVPRSTAAVVLRAPTATGPRTERQRISPGLSVKNRTAHTVYMYLLSDQRRTEIFGNYVSST